MHTLVAGPGMMAQSHQVGRLTNKTLLDRIRSNA